MGEATVEVCVADGVYRVEGDARSNNWLIAFTDWRNRFTAEGRLDGLQREPVAFAYHETDRRKSRRILVRDGVMHETKNGKQRPDRPAPDLVDVVSALFVRPRCRGDQTVHTGRHVYELSRLERDPGGCRYLVTDDDGESFEMELVLDRRDGLVIPTRITVYGWLAGWVELVEPAG